MPRRRGSLSQTLFELVTALVNGLPEFIYLAGLKYYGFVANTADGEIRRRGSHVASGSQINAIAQETASAGSGGQMCERPSKLSTRTESLVCSMSCR
jgi:hypothetical protein